MNTPNIQITPNMFQILKGSTFPLYENYQLGGDINDENSNKKFINTEFRDIKIQYSYQIINLLKKALKKLNNNGIYLEENTINNIKKNIKILAECENELSVFAQKILDATNISGFSRENNVVMDERTLEKYINKHELLLNKSDKIANNLNLVFTNLIDLVENKGDNIINSIDEYLKKN
jgi:hypothetical protein